jgi:hypothetical protein
MQSQTEHRRKIPLIALGAALLWTAGCSERQPTAVSLDEGARLSSSTITPHPMNAAGLASSDFSIAGSHGAIIDNGVIQLGVRSTANLGVDGGTLSSGLSPTTWVGIRYMPTNSDATAPGCICEGWGVADATSGVAGYANVSVDGVVNLTVEDFTATATEAISTVRVGSTFRVTHHYRPSAETPNLYEVVVSIENISGATADLRYRRVMDWDIAPNTFSEYVTIQGAVAATNVIFSSNDGFASANPLAGPSDLGFTGDFVDAGPNDHGALFDFAFGALAPGETHTFTTYYGATADEASAFAALGAVEAEVYSFGQANYDGSGWVPAPGVGAPPGTAGPTLGIPHTFIFAFKGVGGDPIGPPPACIPLEADVISANRLIPRGTITLRRPFVAVGVLGSPEMNLPSTFPALTADDVRVGNDFESGVAATSVNWMDLNRDGRPDLVVLFDTNALRAAGLLGPDTE